MKAPKDSLLCDGQNMKLRDFLAVKVPSTDIILMNIGPVDLANKCQGI